MLSTTIFAICSRTSTTALPRCGVVTTLAIFKSAGVTSRFVLEHVEAGAGDLALPERSRQRLLVDDRPARGIDQEGGRLHQREFTRTDLVPGRRQ